MTNFYMWIYGVGRRHLGACLLVLGLLWAQQPAAAQTIVMPANGTTAYTTCSGTIYDDGGPSGLYSAYANGITTLTPAIAGNKIQLQFTSFQVETGYDRLTIYDGPTLTSPIIGTYDYNSPGTVYATNSTGSLTLRFTSDGSAQYSGYAAAISCVTSVPQADLAVQSAAVQPLAAVAGGNLQLSCYIYNLAAATATSSNVGYYLSTDATLSANDVLLANSNGGLLSGNQSSFRSSSATLPATVAAGNYYVLFVADYQNQIDESNEQNNVSAVSLNVVPANVDLLVQQPYVSSATTAPGNSLSLSCSVLNQGNTPAASSNMGYYLSTDQTLDPADQLLTTSFGGSLSSNSPQYRSATASIAATVTPGSYYVLFAVDYQNQVPETNENNNVAAVALTVQPPTIDVLVSQAQLSASLAVAGAYMSFSSTVFNQGNTTTPLFGQGVYLSQDATLSANDVLLTTTSVYNVPGGSGQYTSGNFTLPTTLTPGSYYVLFVADYLNQLPETNEQNNVRAVTLQVVPPTVDLLMQQPSLTPPTLAAGNQLTLSSYIQNTGNSAAPSSSVGYYLSTDATLSANDVPLGSSVGGSLAASGYSSRYQTVTVPANTAVGSYYVLFVADYQNLVAETNEQNNVSAVTLQVVPAGVDLLVTQPSLSRASGAPGTALSAYSYIYNQGSTAASTSSMGYFLSTDVTLSSNDLPMGSVTGGYLGASRADARTANLTVPAAATAGSYYVLFVADYQNTEAETDENNNVSAVLFNVLPPFNGVIVPQTGQNTVTACNGTVYDNGGTSNYANYSNGSLVISPGTPGAKVQLTFSYLAVESCCDELIVYDGPSTASPRLGYYVTNPGTLVATNSTGALTLQFISDGSVTDAGFEAVISCVGGGSVGPVDLVPSQPSVTPTAGVAGGNVVLSTLLTNQGTGTAGSSSVGYYLSTDATLSSNDVLLGTTPGVALGAGQSATRGMQVTIPGSTALGSYYVLHVADPQNQVAETNESNNVVSSALTVGAARPDLVILQPALMTNSIVAGNNLGISCLLANQGAALAPASVTGYYLSTDNTLSSNDVLLGTAAAGTVAAASATPSLALVLVPPSTAAGSYYVLFVADHTGLVTEANETNNVASLPLSVTVVQGTRNEQLQGLALHVYPSPVEAGAELRVQLTGTPNGRTAQATLVNSLGQEVAHQAIPLVGSMAPVRLSTTGLSRGVYLLRISGAGLRATRRVVIE